MAHHVSYTQQKLYSGMTFLKICRTVMKKAYSYQIYVCPSPISVAEQIY
jgi:hypothetical protein